MAVAKLCIVLTIVTIAHATPMANANEPTEVTLEDNVAKYLQKQEFSFQIPFIGSTVTMGAKNLEADEIDMKVKISNDDQARKSKLKKIFAPILILVILKAITLIPLALGILGLKTWNALQLSFVTFIVSISLAVFELCKKVATDHAHPAVYAHAPWNAARGFIDLGTGVQELVYSAHLK